MFLFSYRDRSSIYLGTLGTARACLAVFRRKLDLDHLIVASINGWGPTGTLVPCWTGRFVSTPIDLKTTRVKALFFFALPLVVRSRGSNQLDAVVEGARDELF